MYLQLSRRDKHDGVHTIPCMYLFVYRASWRVWLRLVAGRSQLKSAMGTGRARLCAYVKLSTLNSAIDPELRDRKVEDRANATSSA